MRTISFLVSEIEALTIDIEELGLPPETNFAVLQFAMKAIEDYAPDANVNISLEAAGLVMPSFLKAQAERSSEKQALKPRTSGWAEAAFEPDVPAHKDFSPAPLPEALYADPKPAPMPEEKPTIAPEIGSVELKTGPWSQEEVDHLLSQRASGVLFKDIALQLCRPIAAVNAKHSNLAKTLPASAASDTAKHGNRWTDEEEAILLHSYARGMAMLDISESLGKSAGACKAKLNYIKERHSEKLEKVRAGLEVVGQKKPASKHVEEVKAAPAIASKAEGGAGVLPRPCPDDQWSIEDDFDLVSEHHRGLSMLDVSIMLERTKPNCVKRYNALMDAMPAGLHTARQTKLKQTLAYHANLAREAA